ncbi:MAG: galactofuranosyltransferase [Bacilli bacterium]|nr:galactofuranosyltransferase [Bacilli bacterium]
MRYFVIEGTPNGEYNATNKAREDVETILTKNGVKPLYISSINGIQTNKLMKWKQFFAYRKNTKIWDKDLSNVNKGDIVFIQYPLTNTTTNLDKVINKYKEKGVVFVAIIHDMDSLRYKPEVQGSMLCKRVNKEDKVYLNAMNYVICHNPSMKSELVKLGNSEDKLISLELFDYILDFEPKKFKRTKNDPVIIAGNLSPFKAKYLASLKDLGVNFNLFGVGYTDEMGGPTINYKGKFKPDELLNHLEGGFGLVWDGESVDTCIGGFGDYLRYNNPHKVSLYLTAGIPVIVWKESALANFITKNKLGIAVSSLNEIKEKIEKLSDKEYDEMLKNISKVSSKTKNGGFLTEAINKVKE